MSFNTDVDALNFKLTHDIAPSRLQQAGSERNVRIETDRASRIIRLTGTKHDSFRTAELLQDICKSSFGIKLDLNQWLWWATETERKSILSRFFTSDDIFAVSNLTRTAISMDQDGTVSIQTLRQPCRTD